MAAALAAGPVGAARAQGAEDVVERLRAAWAGVEDYRTTVEARVTRDGGAAERTRLLLRGKRPGRLRADFETPHPGLVLVYPGGGGRVRTTPGGALGFLRLTLAPDNALLTVAPGQQFHQTDLGLLVANIARSLGAGRLGEVERSEAGGRLVVRVRAENHFLPGVPTRYEFWIDPARWLPAGVRDEVPERGWAREVWFRDLEVNLGLPEALFGAE